MIFSSMTTGLKTEHSMIQLFISTSVRDGRKECKETMMTNGSLITFIYKLNSWDIKTLTPMQTAIKQIKSSLHNIVTFLYEEFSRIQEFSDLYKWVANMQWKIWLWKYMWYLNFWTDTISINQVHKMQIGRLVCQDRRY